MICPCINETYFEPLVPMLSRLRLKVTSCQHSMIPSATWDTPLNNFHVENDPMKPSALKRVPNQDLHYSYSGSMPACGRMQRIIWTPLDGTIYLVHH